MNLTISECSTDDLYVEKPHIQWFVPMSVTATNKFQSVLPRLPVPDLSSTVVKFLKSVRPLLKDDEFNRVCALAFQSVTSEQGRKLQDKLIERAKSKPDSSWLIDWWNDWCYLTDREPLVFFVSYFYAFKDVLGYIRQDTNGPAQSAVAAALVHHAISFRSELLAGTLPPDMSGNKPQCMAQYAYIFNSCRVPGVEKDHYVTYDPLSNKHIVVLCRGHVYSFNVISEDGTPLSTVALQTAFEAVLADARTLGDNAHPIGILTSDVRDRWAEARTQLLGCKSASINEIKSSMLNKIGLELIQSAILAVCLDKDDLSGECCERASQRARAFWHGDGRNRFFDKTLQFIVLASGRCGFVGEHALSDGSPTLRLCDSILSRIAGRGQGGIKAEVAGKSTPQVASKPTCPKQIRRLAWRIPQGVREAMVTAAIAFDRLVAEHALSVVVVEGLGRDGIKLLGLPPDAICQLALQLAFFRVQGRAGATYEAASTRGFLHGRTETIRSCTVEAQAFVAKMQDLAASDADRRTALAAAVTQHQQLTREAGQGLGVDRHLLGLRLLRKDGEPELPLLADPAYRASCSWELSTSTLASEGFESWGFGEVVPHGFGVGYSALAGATTFAVTCRETGGGSEAAAARSRAMSAAIKTAMEDIAALCKRTAPQGQAATLARGARSRL
uniref:Choline/carnitine acyltransferase domain-containing protein n=1 Tax=Cryptomonas curvata TaxID=233186 RepID=A0A7S0MJU4_9CRYP|mmetsp:Transcript_44884/g.94019  ORF Transcript_44884/g.94019 Transcript_44884/m.94019 type:complete len:672 (+) Transcript_44884:243-2258(+)